MHRIYWEDSGGEGFPVVFFYGLGCSIFHWKYQLRDLCGMNLRHEGVSTFSAGRDQLFRGVWFDVRGHGRSQVRPELLESSPSLGLKDVVADARAVCQHRGIERAVFVGQSAGGAAALKLAMEHPELCAGLVLLGSPLQPPSRMMSAPGSARTWKAVIAAHQKLADIGPARGAFSWVVRELMRGIRIPLQEVVRRVGFNQDLARSEDVSEYIEELIRVPPALFYDMAADLERFDIDEFVGRLPACPTLLIAGEKDRVVPLAFAQHAHAQLPNSELFIVPHGSHCPHLDDPGLVTRKMRDFIAQVARSRQ